MKIALTASICGLFAVTVAAQELRPLFPDDPRGTNLPPALPRMVDANGNVIAIDDRYNSPAYYDLASQYILHEINDIAKELQLPDETLPLSATNASYDATGYGRSLKFGILGSGMTKNYSYSFGCDRKFSGVQFLGWEQFCFDARKSPLPIKQLDTVTPYQLATQWMAAASIDVAGLNRDCKVQVALEPWVNGLATLGDKPSGSFVPVYFIWWKPLHPHEMGRRMGDDVEAAHVELYLPAKKLLQFGVSDPKYNLRKPLVITNMAAVFPGTGRVTTMPPPRTIDANSPY